MILGRAGKAEALEGRGVEAAFFRFFIGMDIAYDPVTPIGRDDPKPRSKATFSK